MSDLSRRELLKRASAASAAAAVPVTLTEATQAPAAPARPEPMENLTPAEAETLDAVVARLIPADANGPGAREAGAVRYIDRAIGGALAWSREALRSGLAALETHAVASTGRAFARLPAADQDQLLTALEQDAVPGFAPPGSASFFDLLLNHTVQGTFGDPYYGGNFNFIGWDMIGYPGVRTSVSAEDQRLGANLKPNHQSAYDNAAFNKASHDH
jgi:gluconate 2-dehydrogenase gamma chain